MKALLSAYILNNSNCSLKETSKKNLNVKLIFMKIVLYTALQRDSQSMFIVLAPFFSFNNAVIQISFLKFKPLGYIFQFFRCLVLLKECPKKNCFLNENPLFLGIFWTFFKDCNPKYKHLNNWKTTRSNIKLGK